MRCYPGGWGEIHVLTGLEIYVPVLTSPSALPKASTDRTTVPLPTSFPELSAAPTGAAFLSTDHARMTAPSVVQDTAFALIINGKTVNVACGVAEPTLRYSPGWLDTSARPGEDGVCVVYGHRNRNHLQELQNVKKGDTITVVLNEGAQYKYLVEELTILSADAELTIPTLTDSHLMLVTCYPFHYSGSAPQKYVVLARLS